MAAETDIYNRVFHGDQQGGQRDDSSVMKLNDSDEAEERALQVQKNIASSESAYNAWHGPAKEDMRFYAGAQWDDIDRMRMEQQKRPAIVFNLIKPAIDAVSGLERLNRSDVRFVSRALDSNVQIDAAGDLASEAVSAVDDLCSGAEELSRVAKDAVVCGMGWAEIRMDYSEDLNGRVVYERLPPEEMRWDPNNARKENLEGREWCARKKPVTRKMFERLWGEDKLAAVDLSTPEWPYGTVDRYEMVTPYYSVANQRANPQVGGPTPRKDITVIQYQWRDLQPVYRFIDETSGEETHLDEDQWKTLKDRAKILGSQPPPAVKQMQPVFRQSFYARGVELEDPVDLPGGFSLLCVTGQYDDEKKRWYGLVRNMVDPQKVQNKAMSSAVAFHVSNAKGGVLFRPRAFDDPRRAQDMWSQPDAWIPVADDADITKDIVPRSPTVMPPELTMFYSEANKAITAVSGVSPELIGQATGQVQSQTAQGRVQGGLVVLGWFFDNLRRHHKEKAAMMLEFVREYWTQGQLIQVGGDFNSQSIPLLKESLPDRWQYSLVLDDSVKHNPNLKAQIWRDLMETGVLQALMKFGLGQVIIQLLKFSPFPAQIISEVQKAAMQSAQNPQPQAPGRRGQQGQPPGARGPTKPPEPPQLIAANVALKSAQAQKAMAQAREIDMRAGISPAKLTLEALAQSHNQQLDQQKQQHAENVHGHQRNLDATNAMLKGIGTVGGLMGRANAQQPQPQMPPMPPDGGMLQQ
jgi:hypothetical protein